MTRSNKVGDWRFEKVNKVLPKMRLPTLRGGSGLASLGILTSYSELAQSEECEGHPQDFVHTLVL